MNKGAPRRGAAFSSPFATILSLARERITELGCPPVGENPKAFVGRGGLRRLGAEAAEAAIRRVREAAYPLIFKLFGAEMPRGKECKLMLSRLGQDLARIEKNLGYRVRSTRVDARTQTRKVKRPSGQGSGPTKRREN